MKYKIMRVAKVLLAEKAPKKSKNKKLPKLQPSKTAKRVRVS